MSLGTVLRAPVVREDGHMEYKSECHRMGMGTVEVITKAVKMQFSSGNRDR